MIFVSLNYVQFYCFNHLNSAGMDDGNCDTEIEKSIEIDKDALQKISKVLKHTKIFLEKQRICKCWTMSSLGKKKLETNKIWFA